MNGEGAAPPETAPDHQGTNTHKDAGRSQSTRGDGAGEDVQTGLAFIEHLDELGVPLFTAEPGGRRDVVPDLDNEGELIEVILRNPNDPEFVRPRGWPSLTAEGNQNRIGEFRCYKALCAICGKPIAVVDVDPRNGGDIEKVRALLDELKVRIFAEVDTPSGGKHFYIAGHPDLPSIHSTVKNERLPGFPGVDIQSFGCNVFAPGTQRPKYGGAGYVIVSDDLDALVHDDDPEGAEAIAAWVAENLAQTAKAQGRKAQGRKAKGVAQEWDWEPCKPWSGAPPDARQRGYLDAVLRGETKKVATTAEGGRNWALFLAALKCSCYVAGAGMDGQKVKEALRAAAAECRYTEEHGSDAVEATIRSGFRAGTNTPRAVPDPRFPPEWLRPGRRRIAVFGNGAPVSPSTRRRPARP